MSRIGKYITSATSYYCNILSSVSPLNKNVCILTSPEKNADNFFLPYNVKHISSRCCMNQNRLNHIMLMSVHKTETKKLSLEEVADDFISRNEKRRSDFGVRKKITQ